MSGPEREPPGSPPSGRSIEERLAAAGLPSLPRAAWLEIDLDALRGNLRLARRLVGPGVDVAAVVKADAYGHGIEMAVEAFGTETSTMCVATLDEGLAVRALDPRLRVIVLYPVPLSGLPEATAAGLELVASDEADTHALLRAHSHRLRTSDVDGSAPAALRLHLEVDSGLGRGGVPPERAGAVAAWICETRGVALAGLWSHLASPDQASVTAAAVERFEAATRALQREGVAVPPRHIAASGGMFAGTAPAYEMVRAGLGLYGEQPPEVRATADATGAHGTGITELRPAMTLKARPIRVAHVPRGAAVGYGGRWIAPRPSTVAILPVGYGDGWARAYQPGSSALVRGIRVALVGTVAMDAVAVDVTDVPGVDARDELVLLGAAGGDRIGASELAQRRDTNEWEVLTGMAARLPRVYHSGPVIVALRTWGARIVDRAGGRAQ